MFLNFLASIAMAVSVAAGPLVAQEPYRRPPAEIVKILEAPPLPSVVLDPARTTMVLVTRENLPPIADLAQPMLRLAGSRINPATNGPHGPRRLVGLTIKDVASGKETPVKLPADPDLGMPSWSPDGSRFAFTITKETGIELWISDASGNARALTGPTLNGVGGRSFGWMPDSRTLLCRFVPEGRGVPPARAAAPAGPVIQETSGSTAPVRTYQDLLQDVHDEKLFDYYFAAQPAYVNTDTGKRTDFGPVAIYGGLDASPDGEFLLVSRTVRPYSYLVTSGSFPEVVEVWTRAGKPVREICKVPLREDVPIQGVEKGPRRIDWSDTAPATLTWAEALDEGDPKMKVPHRDRLMVLSAPFTAEPLEILKTEHRFMGLRWMQTPGYALVSEYDRDRRWSRTWLCEIGAPTDRGPRLVWDRSVQDRYGDPGNPVSVRLPNGRSVVRVDDGMIYLSGAGATPEGNRPFLDRMSLADFTTERLWRCEGETYESIVDVLADAGRVITTYETPSDPPNYFIRTLADGTRHAITSFKDPAPELRNIKKELVTYQRADGVALSATMYLPPNYKPGTRLPLLVWAYPLEFNDPSTAGQVSGSPYRFTQIGGISHLFLLTQGYAVMDDATMPVIGEPETVNDTFVEQIVAAAKAAIDKAAEMGVADPKRVAVGGHSYGAFMTANLMAHSDLFRAGIARSGAYNRTLTPFGFQGERRTFWEATDTYINLSPFSFANKINEPLLLIHGQIDSNPGTFPIQSERLYQAIKGHGGTARLVMLPFESHGYSAKESVMHTLAEMIDWLDTHVKSGPVTPTP